MATKRQIHMMTAMVVLAALLMVAMPGRAQEAVTVAAMPVDVVEWALVAIAGALVLALVVVMWRFGDLAKTGIEAARSQAPAWAVELVQTTVQEVTRDAFARLDAMAARTPGAADDRAITDARRVVYEALNELGLLPVAFGQIGDDDDTSPLGKLAGPTSGQ